MNIAAIITILAGIAKVTPTFARWADEVGAAWVKARAEAKRTADYELIDSTIAEARAQPWVCPAVCPHRLQHNADADGKASG